MIRERKPTVLLLHGGALCEFGLFKKALELIVPHLVGRRCCCCVLFVHLIVRLVVRSLCFLFSFSSVCPSSLIFNVAHDPFERIIGAGSMFLFSFFLLLILFFVFLYPSVFFILPSLQFLLKLGSAGLGGGPFARTTCARMARHVGE